MTNEGIISIEVSDADWHRATDEASMKDLMWRASLSAKYNGDVKKIVLRKKSGDEVVVLFQARN